MAKIKIERSSGNVFADLGIDRPEEARIQSDLALAIARLVRERKWTQAQAAAELGVSQSDVSSIVRGKLKGFSIERLVRLLGKLGRDVRVEVLESRTAESRLLSDIDVFAHLDSLIPDTLETRTVGAQEWLRLKLTEVMIEVRRRAGLTQHEMVELLDLTQSQVSDLENANLDRNLDSVVQYLTALGADLLLAVKMGDEVFQASRNCWLVDVPLDLSAAQTVVEQPAFQMMNELTASLAERVIVNTNAEHTNDYLEAA